METQLFTDSHFVIGKDHITQNTPCQDHALQGSVGEYSFIVVSDGCSSGRHTDIGARVITCALVKVLKRVLVNQPVPYQELPDLIALALIAEVEVIAGVLDLTNDDLLATCAYAVLGKDGGFVHVLGDGAVVLRNTSGETTLYQTNWGSDLNKSAPYYPADINKQQFIAAYESVNQGQNALIVTKTSFNGERIHSVVSNSVQVRDAVKGLIIPITAEDMRSIELVGITTDGVERFKSEAATIPVTEIVKEMTAFKTWAGEFVKRRMSRALMNFSKKEVVWADDVSIAAIHIVHSKTESYVD